MAMTKAQTNRAIRQESLREQLSKKGLLQQAIETITKIEQLDIGEEEHIWKQNFQLNKLKIANEHRLRLINKYLPDLKLQENTGEGGGPIEIVSPLNAKEAEAISKKLEDEY
jgi:hypothetical protein